MSANPGQPDVADALRAGAVTTFLKKPFDVDELVDQIRAAVVAHENAAHKARE